MTQVTAVLCFRRLSPNLQTQPNKNKEEEGVDVFGVFPVAREWRHLLFLSHGYRTDHFKSIYYNIVLYESHHIHIYSI